MTAEERILAYVDKVIGEGPYSADWASLAQAPEPAWFRERRLGIFIHWGVYSVPAFSNEWYPREMYMPGMRAYEHHLKTYGPPDKFGYKDFIPRFTGEHFDAAAWVRLFREAGAGYMFPVAEHHDGFQMYKSELSPWNAAQMGPHRDVLGELKAAAEREGLLFCASSHRAEHWFFLGHGKEIESDVKEPLKKGDFYWPAMPEGALDDLFSEPYPSAEFLDDWLARTAELIVNYRPRLLYFDWWIQHEAFKPYLKKLLAFYYNLGVRDGTPVRVCYKHDALPFGVGIPEVERGGFADAKPFLWQTDTAVARNAWCYTTELQYKSGREIVQTLVDAVSKGGNLLLNIGPKPDGTIPEPDRRLLKELGTWMRVNREAIDGAKPWRIAGEGPTVRQEGQFTDKAETPYCARDFRFTAANGCVYAMALRCPEDGRFLIRSLGKSPDQNLPAFHGILRDVTILGWEQVPVQWHADLDGLHVCATGVASDLPVTLRIAVE